MRPARITALLATASLIMPAAAICAALGSMHGTSTAHAAARRRRTPTFVQAAPASHVIGVVTDGPITGFERDTGTRVELAVRYLRWGKAFPLEWARSLELLKVMPVVEIEPSGISLQAVANGDDDAYLHRLSRLVGALHGRVALCFAPEANGSWYPWGDQPRSFKRAWRHVVSAIGRQRVTWVWIMHHSASLAAYWPGSPYVTWIGIDGYFEYAHDTFSSLFAASIHSVRRFTHRTPILLSEVAVGPATGHQARDIRDLFAGVERDHLLGLIWFDIAQHAGPHHQDWRLEDNPAALRAFRDSARAYLGSLGHVLHPELAHDHGLRQAG